MQDKKLELEKDERSNPNYWNGDSWGSISGFRDAQEWMNKELKEYRKSLVRK
jgi:hypothetical protein